MIIRHPRPTFFLALLFSWLAAGSVSAQSDLLSSDLKKDYRSIRDYFIRAAEKMPEENYPFKPSPDVRALASRSPMSPTINTIFALPLAARSEKKRTDTSRRRSQRKLT